MLLANGMTIADWLHANMALLSTAGGIFFAALTGGVGWFFREVWKSNRDRRDLLAKNEIECSERRLIKEETLLTVMSEHFPKQSETLTTMQECLVEGRKRDSDVIRVLGAITDGMDNVAVAVLAGACPERAELAAAHLKEHLARVEKRKAEAKK